MAIFNSRRRLFDAKLSACWLALPAIVAALVGVEARAADSFFDGVLDLANLDGTNGFAINGINPGPLPGATGDTAGWAVSSAGDLNNDGFSDLVIGAPNSSLNGLQYAGESYVVFGGTTLGAGGSFNLSSLNGTNGFVLRGGGAQVEHCGTGVSRAGDVNADGVDDVIVTCVGVNGAHQTHAYVLFGGTGVGSSGLVTEASLNGANGFVVNGINGAVHNVVPASAAGDVNNDGVDDFIIGSYVAGNARGESYVVFGGAGLGGSGSINVSALNGSDGFRMPGVMQLDGLGISVSGAGDVNADGVDDLVVGADEGYRIPFSPGESYVVFGSTGLGGGGTFNVSSLTGANGYVVRGAQALSYAGSSVSNAGDVNHDGVDDLLIGAPGADPNGMFNAGESYVLFGGSTVGASGTVALAGLNGANGFKLSGLAMGDSAASVSGAGDINGDGVDDFMVGAPLASPLGRSGAGETYVVFGKSGVGAGGAFNLAALTGANGFVLQGIEGNSGGSINEAGDVNGDGIDDLIIGAPWATANGQESAGQSYVVFGARRPPASRFRVSGLRAFDVFSPPNDDVNDFHITLHGITDPLVPGSEIADVYPQPGTTPTNLPAGWYPPTVSLTAGGAATEIAYGGSTAPMVLGQKLHFGVQLTPHGEDELDAICAHWTRNGQPFYEGNDPHMPITVFVDNPGPGESPIQIINQRCPEDGDFNPFRWIGSIYVVDDADFVDWASLQAGSPYLEDANPVVGGPSFMAPAGSVPLPASVMANAAAGRSIIVWYDVFADNNGAPGQLIGTSYTAFNILAVPEPPGAVMAGALVAAILVRARPRRQSSR